MKKIILFLIFLFGFGINQSFATSLSNFTYSGSVTLTGQMSVFPLTPTISNSGGKMYVGEYSTLSFKVHQYRLSTPYNITSYTWEKTVTLTGGTIASHYGSFRISQDGTNLYRGAPATAVPGNMTIYQWKLSVAFDIATAIFYKSFLTDFGNNVANTQTSLKYDGSSIYLNYNVGGTTARMAQYTLTTPFDISTATGKVSIQISPNDSACSLSSDGSELFCTPRSGITIYKYNLSTPFSILSLTGQTSQVYNSGQTNGYGTQISSNGKWLYIPTLTNGKILQFYNSGTGYIMPSEYTCNDGIQNQGETGIDVGGPCGNNTFQSGSLTCSTKTYNDPTVTPTRISGFGTLSGSAWDSNDQGALGFQDSANNGLDTDYFRGIYFGNGSYLPHEVMGWNSVGIANVEYLEGRLLATSPIDPRIKVVMKRGGYLKTRNILQCSGTGLDSAGNLVTGCTHAQAGTYGVSGVPLQIYNILPCTTDNTTNYCTINFPTPVSYTDLHIYSGFTGLRFGNVSATVNKIECSNSSYGCSWQTYGTGFACKTTIKQNSYGEFISGDCAENASGACVPTSALRDPNVFEHCILDGSGACVGIVSGAMEGDDIISKDIVDDIFSCPQYTDWTSWPQCILQVIKNSYGLIKKSVNTANNDSSSSIAGTLKTIGTGTTARNYGTWSNTGVNLVDSVYRRSWNMAFDNTQTLTGFGRAALFGTLMMIILAIILSITFLGPKLK